jgi:hypothetical protein
MKLQYVAAGASLLANLALAASASAASVALQTGWYTEAEYVSSVTPGKGGKCPDTDGQYLTKSFFYPGPGKTGALQYDYWIFDLLSTPHPGVPYQTVLAFEKTPPANVTTITSEPASYKIYTLGSKTPTGNGTIKLSANWTVINAASAVGTSTTTWMSDTIHSTYVGCVEILYWQRIFTGTN